MVVSFCLLGTFSAEGGSLPGIVVAWGWNGSGPTSVSPGLSNVVAVAAGFDFSLALKSNGTVLAWGYNEYGQTNVPAGLSNVVAVTGGGDHGLALRSNGTVVAWGWDVFGQTDVPPGLSNAVAIAAGDWFSLALRSDGTVVAWGYDGDGETNVPAGLTNVVAVAAGGKQSLVITSEPCPLSEPPPAISLALGAGTNLSVVVLSGGPFTCQWSLNGLPIPGATATNLAISNFNLTKAGAYSVVVTNQYGSASAISVLRLTNSPVILVDGVDVGGGTVRRTNTTQVTMRSRHLLHPGRERSELFEHSIFRRVSTRNHRHHPGAGI